jgi:hypothetical protein
MNVISTTEKQATLQPMMNSLAQTNNKNMRTQQFKISQYSLIACQPYVQIYSNYQEFLSITRPKLYLQKSIFGIWSLFLIIIAINPFMQKEKNISLPSRSKTRYSTTTLFFLLLYPFPAGKRFANPQSTSLNLVI